jgi:hypothetical protein
MASIRWFREPAVAMNENGKKRPIRAGQAFIAAVADDSPTPQSLTRALLRLKLFADGIRTAGATYHEAMEAVNEVFAAIDGAWKDSAADLRAEQKAVFAELAAELKQAKDAETAELASYGLAPGTDNLEAWEELARIVGKEPSPMTIREICLWAIAWAKRELWRQKLSRGELPIQADEASPERQRTTPPEDVGIRRDENDPRFAWCMSKRIYLGKDSQIGRLFWLLASPVGRARTLAEVQRAVDGFETNRALDAEDDEFKQASQRLRKALSKLRQALREAEVDAHLLVVRGGSAASPEYTMVLRYGAS